MPPDNEDKDASAPFLAEKPYCPLSTDAIIPQSNRPCNVPLEEEEDSRERIRWKAKIKADRIHDPPCKGECREWRPKGGLFRSSSAGAHTTARISAHTASHAAAGPTGGGDGSEGDRGRLAARGEGVGFTQHHFRDAHHHGLIAFFRCKGHQDVAGAVRKGEGGAAADRGGEGIEDGALGGGAGEALGHAGGPCGHHDAAGDGAGAVVIQGSRCRCWWDR